MTKLSDLVSSFIIGHQTHFYVYIGILMFANSLIMVPPSEYICITAGILTGAFNLSFIYVVIIATIANHLGTMPWYIAGLMRRNDSTGYVEYRFDIIKHPIESVFYLYTSRLRAVETKISQGPLFLIVIRLVPVIRSIASYPAGRIGMPIHRFTISSLIGIFIWVLLWASLGNGLGFVALKYKAFLSIGAGVASLSVFLFLFKRLGRITLD
jgi:membrane protein DedA with SNARE-associated domain